MSNKILVTGASGNIGSPLVQELKALGADFAVMSSKPGAAMPGVETRHGDFGSVASLTEAFKGIDTVFLLFPLVPNKLVLATNAASAAKAAGGLSAGQGIRCQPAARRLSAIHALRR